MKNIGSSRVNYSNSHFPQYWLQHTFFNHTVL